MQTTMHLLQRALAVQNQARWADALDLSDATLSQAKKRGRLSPTIAGAMAAELGEDPAAWISVAALEAEPDTATKRTLLKRLSSKIQKL
ncbi:Uncharacterised protein [Xylophilus ampelinus]|nr:Uncharacterised protein [Xylophilus ampelinus]